MRTLIIVNNSPLTEGALQFGAQITSKSTADSTLMAIIPHSQEGELKNAKRILEQTRDYRPFQRFQKKVRVGPLAKEIQAEIRDGAYELLVLPTPITTKPEYLQPRSVLTEIVEEAPCSVLVVKALAPSIQRILLCDSGSDAAVSLRSFTTKLINSMDNLEELTILHVMSQVSAGPGIRGEQLRSDAESLIRSHTPEGILLERDLQELSRAGVLAVPKIRHGLVVDEILEESREGRYDLVIIGAHVPAGWQKLLLENLARKILSQIDRSLLIAKSGV